ncbi:hypothetical protein MCOR27_008329 [Pyricularia oryzae]|uniref:Zn(2)-C6 fungal-type domain-containing protein n=2 Tax=Pyricularia TaxID=48558 RepID=A0ABQ8NBJ9_PYRGI|nr:hypothetical protein MCOR01_011026 [Pyricularia oryzae]KAI6294455.1 hypothetical protein MCOR33_008429 [Pyricularia grisea]KAI6272440.1 hypothetical protein MCOR27_008329 [Pyricularia oryzae]KAI6283045.1 hypothetical protein MCOR26_002588 [Pyricularia oryzae]KAI6315399.1 hypothetical protein MCOR29_007008 [Pyricularia oryzae]
MTSVASSGTSPRSGYDHLHGEFLADDESWAFIDQTAASNAGSVGFFPSPESGSLRSYGLVAHQSQLQPSPPAPSPLQLDQEHIHHQQQHRQQHQQPQLAGHVFSGDAGIFAEQHMPQSCRDDGAPMMDPNSFPEHPNLIEQMTIADQLPFLSNIDTLNSHLGTQGIMAGNFIQAHFDDGTNDFVFGDHEPIHFDSYGNPFLGLGSSRAVPGTGVQSPASLGQHTSPHQSSLGIPPTMQSDANAAPWDPSAAMLPKQDQGQGLSLEDFMSSSSPRAPTTPLSSQSPAQSASPMSPEVKQEPGTARRSSGTATTAPKTIRKVKGGARVEKKKSPSETAASGSLSSSAGTTGSGSYKFITMTSTAAAAQAGKPHIFECFERMTQRGRKGPLPNETKKNAQIVRRVGACFCCHARKVKCDAERPCKNCKKLAVQVPQIVCWQFGDFLNILFPEVIRGHFRKDQMAKFIADNVNEFKIGSSDRQCTVELSSGTRLASTLVIPAKAFSPKDPDILQHWRQDNEPDGTVRLSHGVAAPIGLDLEGSSGPGAQREELRKIAKEYIQSIIREQCFADEMTASIRSTDLPGRVLRIVQTYALRSQSDMVKRALSIYTINYVMTRHLTFTPRGVNKLVRMGLVSPHHAVQTPRLLARQFKAVLDEINLREMQLIFESFSKSLKPKVRKEWAPCLAAFLVLTLFMEEVEVSLDTFGTAQNEISSLRGDLHPIDRREILDINAEIENMPFKQFAYQFHQIYQTHSNDASARPFNPLVDDSLLNEQFMDQPAIDMVRSLRELLWDMDTEAELDFLAELDYDASHPFPSDLACRYAGRLMARFLLSFNNIQRLLVH